MTPVMICNRATGISMTPVLICTRKRTWYKEFYDAGDDM